MKLKSNHIEIVKYIAIILMVLDHYSNLFLSDDSLFKIAGRVVFPLFAVILVYNYIYNSSDKLKYIFRLSLFALISQPIYSYVFYDYFNSYMILNIFFTLSLGLSLIYLNESIIKDKNLIEKTTIYFLFSVILIPFSFIFLSYKVFGLILIITTYMYLKNKSILNFILLIASIYFLNYAWSPTLSAVALLSIPIIWLISKINFKLKRINKWFFYLFYPIHLILLKLI